VTQAHQDIRWQQRFQNFSRAFGLLREAIERPADSLSQLEKEGIIQRFEYTFELAWKVLKDKMEFDGLVLDQVSPKAVVRQAFTAHYIDAPEAWLKMVGDRNLMSHAYDFAQFELIIQSIRDEYFAILEALYLALLEEVVAS